MGNTSEINIVPNGGFEFVEPNGRPSGEWEIMNGESLWASGDAVIVDRAFGGKNALRVDNKSGGQLYLRVIMRENIKPGAVYTASARINYSLDATARIGMYAEFYRGDVPDDPATCISQKSMLSIVGGNTNEQFNLEEGTFTMPTDTKMALLYFTLGGKGMMVLDDVSVWQSGEPEPYRLSTDNVFYYPDDEKAMAYVTIDSYYKPDDAPYRSTVDYRVLDGDTVLAEESVTFADDGVSRFEYPTSIFAEKEHMYTVEIAVKSESGEVIRSATKEAYVYDRPTVLGRDGLMRYPGEDGIFHPIIAYWPLTDYAKMKGIGINVVELNNSGDGFKAKLDRLHALGMKGMVCLWAGPDWMMPPTTPKNIDWAREKLAEIGDHPAVFGWCVCDEPLGGRGYDETMMKHLIESYKLIREYDKTKPVYLLDYNKAMYGESQKYGDQFIVDVYSTGNTVAISKQTALACAVTSGRKPVYYIGMTYKASWSRFPTETDVRGGVYRAFEEGAVGIGWYTLAKAYGQEAGDPVLDLPDTELWEPMVKMYENEWEHLFDYYAEGRYPTFCRHKPEGYDSLYYEGWMNGGDLYLVVHNRSVEDMTAKVPLESVDGASLGDREVAVIGGAAGTVATVDGGDLSVALRAQEACLLRLTRKIG